jgi:phosphatidyl-myo-inositol alpha-mannosyltransferase
MTELTIDSTTPADMASAIPPAIIPGSERPRSTAALEAISLTPVLHVINGEHYSGAERVQDLLAQNLPGCGFEVGFACLKPKLFPRVLKAQNVPLRQFPMRWKFDLHCSKLLARWIRAGGYRLIHAHTPRSALLGSMAAQQVGVPFVYHVHSPTARDSDRRWHNWLNARLEKWTLRRAAHIITVSMSLRDQMLGQGTAPNRVTCVPNGVPVTGTRPRTEPTNPWTLGITALFRPRKGMEVLLQALAALKSSGFDLRLRAIGPFETPEYESSILALVDKLGLASSITWTGFVQEISTELQQVDLLVLPSLYGEGTPMVVLEAMAEGLPVIASSVEGITEAIRHREDGLLVEPGSVSQLVQAIAEAVQGTLDYSRLSANVLQRHATHYSSTIMAAGVAEVYQQVLEG